MDVPPKVLDTRAEWNVHYPLVGESASTNARAQVMGGLGLFAWYEFREFVLRERIAHRIRQDKVMDWGMAKLHMELADIYMAIMGPRAHPYSIPILRVALGIYESLSELSATLMVYERLANAEWLGRKDLHAAEDLLKKYIQIAEENNLSSSVTYGYQRLGELYLWINDHEKKAVADQRYLESIGFTGRTQEGND